MNVSRKLSELAWRAYKLLVPLANRTGITKIRVRQRPLGFWAGQLVRRVARHVIPEPTRVHDMLMYHHLDRRAWLGWLYTTDYEPETRELFQRIVQPGMTVVDVGAQIGYFTLLFARLAGANGKVYSFEPDPTVYRILGKNIEANNLGGTVEAVNVAVADTAGQAPFHQVGVGGTLFEFEGSVGTIETEVTALDAFFCERRWPPVHVVKVDTEGAEPQVLRGMRELCRRNDDLRLVVEYAPSNLSAAGTSPDELMALLGEMKFDQVTVLCGDGKRFELPRDAAVLIDFARPLGPVLNLLCEKGPRNR